MDSIRESLGKLKEKALYDKKKTARILLIVLIIVVALFIKANANSNKKTTVEANAETSSSSFVVDISGAVKKPGVYKVDSSTRVYEVIEMAGGLTDTADSDSINQAEYVTDGQKIVIPCVAVAEESADGTGAAGSAAAESSNGKININTAGIDQLTELTGIGDVIAQRIIDYRAQSRFNSIEDIKNVKGIGDAIFAKISDKITV